ncbi:MAG: hypothetical protein JRD93_09870 [Deltaproteobacteria bacterium]|nr:hypothetical protein [Deltaproteobacteria bacterium]
MLFSTLTVLILIEIKGAKLENIITQTYEIQTPFEAEKLIELGMDHIGSVVVSGNKWKHPLIRNTIKKSILQPQKAA